MTRSIVGALTIGLSLCLALVMSVQWSVARVAIVALMQDNMLGELRQDADELAAAVVFSDSGGTALSIGHFDPVFLQPQSGRYFQVLAGQGGGLRSPSLGARDLGIGGLPPERAASGRHPGFRGETLLYEARGYRRDGHDFTVVVAADLAPQEVLVDHFIFRYTLLTAIMCIVLVALQAWIVRRALAPLHVAKGHLVQAQKGEIAALPEAAPDEVLPLIRGINRLLAVQAERLSRSREALGNLSHALKTPLTRLTQLTEDESLRAAPELRRQMLEQLAVVTRRIDRELRHARLAGHGSGEGELQLAVEFDPLIDTLRKLHHDRAIEISREIAPTARFRGDREDLLELGGNLLDNACKWARRKVHVRIDTDSGFHLSVEDDGPGCSAEDCERLGARGLRLDESTAGHGLGLSIVRSIVGTLGGDIHFSRSAALGGLRVDVRLPEESGHTGASADPAPRRHT